MEHTPSASRGSKILEILVAGRLRDGFSRGLGENIEQRTTPTGTLLVGPMIDAAHAAGILDQLAQLGIEILRFETFERDRGRTE